MELTPEQQEKLKNMTPEQLAALQKQQCIFCQIVDGKIPAKKIYEDEHSLAVLDIRPATKGHILLLPKEHFFILPQVPDNILGHLFTTAKKLSKMLLKNMQVPGTSIMIANGPAAGQNAQHVLIHIIPRKEGDGLFNSEEKLIDKEMVQKIKTVFENPFRKSLGLPVTEEQKTLETEEVPQEPEEKQEEVAEKEEPSSKEETQEEPTQEKKEGVSLDDIADLFK